MLIHLRDTWGRTIFVEVIVGLQTVSLTCSDAVVGIGNREYLHDWLREPEGVYAYDRIMWLCAGNGVALAIDDLVPAWPLADPVLAELRGYV